MIEGRSSGSGPYSYHETSKYRTSVLVAHMPGDGFNVRVVFKDQGEVGIPTLKLDETTAMLLWSSLSGMAKDLKWDDRIPGDIAKDLMK